MPVKYLLVAVLMLIGSVWTQSDPSASDVINSLPPELQGKVDEKQIQEIQNKSTEVFKDKCEKNGGADAFSVAEKSFKTFTGCLESLVNLNILQTEIENAKPNGQVDEVFQKYCAKTPQFKGCFRNMTEAAKPCFTPEERTNLKTVHNVSEQLAEFICFKEGDRIALFIAEGGPECVQSKQEQIQSCVNKTFGAEYHVDANNFTVDNIPKISFGEKECGQFTEFQECVVDALGKCEQPTSGNIADSLFNFIRKATPCKDFKNPNDNAPGSASGLFVTSLTLVLAVISLLV